MKHSLAAAPLALALGAGAFAVTPALAATPSTQQATVWSAFSTSTDADKASENLHFYVETPVIKAAQVGQKVTFTPNGSHLSFDCFAAIAVVSPTSWTQVGSIQNGNINCWGTRYNANITITKAMVGKRLELNGWAKADDSVRTATVRATVAIGDQVISGSDSTRRTASDDTAPVQQLGTWYGQKVGIATSDGGNELVIGTNRQAMPDGDVVHASIDQRVVNVWLADGQDHLYHWTRNLATGRVELKTWSIDSYRVGVPGIVARVYDEDTHAPTQQVAMGWNGVERASYNWGPNMRTFSFEGFTDTAVVFSGDGLGHTRVYMHPMAGGDKVTYDAGGLVNVQTRPDGAVVRTAISGGYGNPCLLTLAGTCTPLG